MTCAIAAIVLLTSFGIGVPALAIAAEPSQNPNVTLWKEFFAEVLPPSKQNFSSIKGRGKDLPFVESYRVDASLPSLVADCDIEHGGHPGATFWSLDCKAPQYMRGNGSAIIAGDIGAALPDGFKKSSDRFGNPVWKRAGVTVTAWLILDTDNAYTVTVCHAVDVNGCDV
jgi:hypothetical protein